MRELLEAELAYRATQGLYPVPVREFEERLQAIGYRRDRSKECRSMARYVSGPRDGASYPSCDTTPVEIESGLRFCNVDADRGARYQALKDLRDMFAVTRDGFILEW